MSVDIKTALLDLRFDYPNNTPDIKGNTINSLKQCKPAINEIKSLGFNTVVIALDVPINLTTGQIDLGNAKDSTNRALPKDLWKIVDYAKSIGINTYLKLSPVDHQYDFTLSGSTNFGPGITIEQVLHNVGTYQTQIAKIAEQHGVAGIYVGDFNWGLDTAQYANSWQSLINSVRSVFTGKIMYLAGYDNAVWPMTDIITFNDGYLISNTTNYHLTDIVRGYYDSLTHTNIIQRVIDLTNKYNKPLLLDGFSQNKANPGAGNTVDAWSVMMSNPLHLDDLNLTPYPHQQAVAFAAFLEVANNQLNNYISGFGINEWAPWSQARWIKNPTTESGKMWNLQQTLGNNLWDNALVKSVLKKYLTTESDFHTLHFSSQQSDQLIGFNNSTDTAVFLGSLVESVITVNNKEITVSNNYDGTDRLIDIERLEFVDYNLAFDKNAEKLYNLYQATDRTITPEDFGLWLSRLDNEVKLSSIANAFVTSDEFRLDFNVAATDQWLTNDNIKFVIDAVYTNLFDRSSTTKELKTYFNLISKHKITVGEFITKLSDSAPAYDQFNQVELVGVAYTPSYDLI